MLYCCPLAEYATLKEVPPAEGLATPQNFADRLQKSASLRTACPRRLSEQDFSENRLLSSRFLRDSATYLQKIRAKKIQQAISQKSADSASGLSKSPDCFARNPRAGCEKSAIYFSGARPSDCLSRRSANSRFSASGQQILGCGQTFSERYLRYCLMFCQRAATQNFLQALVK